MKTTQWSPAWSPKGVPPYSVSNVEIHKSPLDDMNYRYIRLEQNQLHVLLVQNSTTDKAAASMDVKVGHISDPADMPGLAHFLEHLLFCGSQRFPKENEYKEYIKSRGGRCNAYTAAQNTNYHFAVAADAFSGALERFSSVFEGPLFSPSSTAREINAVNSENSKNQQADSRRLHQLMKSLSDRSHPWNKFGCGSKDTLSRGGQGWHDSEEDGGPAGKETRRRLVEWWETHYCANRMRLVLVGRESLDALASMAASNFSSITNRGLDRSRLVNSPPWSTSGRREIIYVKSLKDERSLEVYIPIPFQGPLYRLKAASFLTGFLGHEAPGSIHQYLHKRGLITSLSAGTMSIGDGATVLVMDISLTKHGFIHYHSILEVMWKYIELLKEQLISSTTSLPYFEEHRTLGEVNFKFASKAASESIATAIAVRLNQWYTTEDVLCGPYIYSEYSPDSVKEVLNSLRPENARVFLAAKSFEDIGLQGQWLQEKWYGTDYMHGFLASTTSETLSPEQLAELHLPDYNNFIPSNLQVDKKSSSEVIQPLKAPHLLCNTPLGMLWYKKDDQFWLPKAMALFKFESPLASVTPLHAARTRIFIALVNDYLTPHLYDATLAGLSYTITTSHDGFSVCVSGYNDKLGQLLERIMRAIHDFKIQQDRFDIILEKTKDDYDNFYIDQSGVIADYFGSFSRDPRLFLPEEKRVELEFLTLQQISHHRDELLHQTFVTALVHGNASESAAVDLFHQVKGIVNPIPLNPTARPTPRSLLLPSDCNLVYTQPVPNEKEPNSALSYYCHVGDIADEKTRPRLDLLAEMMNEPFFDTLRTKEQLGYNVTSGRWSRTASLGLRLRVQSERHPDFLEARVDAFLEHYKEILEEMTEDRFIEYRDGVAKKKREKLNNMKDEQDRFWAHINSGYYDFERAERDAAVIETIALEDVKSVFMRFIHPSSPTRTKLSIRLVSQAIVPNGEGATTTIPSSVPLQTITNLKQFRQTLQISAGPQPVKDYTI